MSGTSPPSIADGSEMGGDDAHRNGVGSPRTMAAKQMEMESELQQLKSMLSAIAGTEGPDAGAEPPFVLSDEHRFALHHRRYHEDSSESDDDDYTQFDQRRRQMERVLERELKTLRREKDMIQSIRSLRRDRDALLEKERAWERERLALEKEIKKMAVEPSGDGDENGVAPDSTDAVQTSSAPEPAATAPGPADKQTEVLDLTQYAVPKLNYVEWSTFKALRENPESKSFAIDVLKGEPVVTFDFTAYWRPKKAKQSRGKVTETKPAVASTKADAKQKQPPVPERIRIHSKTILKILDDISGETLSASGEPIVMIRPFKFLIYHEEQIRLKFNELKAMFDGGNIAAGNAAPEQAAVGPQVQDGGADDKDKDGIATSAIAYEQLKCLIEFMDTEMQAKIRSLSGDAGESQAQNVSFTDIWYLFKPGDEVIDQRCRQVYRVVGMTSVCHKVISPWRNYYDRSEAKSDETPVTLHCVYVDFDGKHLGPVSKLFEIPRFDGERAITSLDVYPLRYAERRGTAKDAYRQMFIRRGRMFLDVAGVRHMHYNGLTLDARDEVDSQVVIDFEEAFVARGNSDWRPDVEQLIGQSKLPKVEDEQCSAECCRGETIHKDGDIEVKRSQDYIGSLIPENRNRVPSVAIYTRLLKETRSPGNALTDDELVIMTYRVFGFVLRSRKWAKLDLTYLSPINSIGKPKSTGAAGVAKTEDEIEAEKKETAFEQLVLPEGHKNMVLSLIAQHYRDKESGTADTEQVDIVRGKGKGLIILLHGAPGVGKTTTAEGVAELFKKPLFQITCGDLGTTASDVELALETNFALANRWGCILLLDEADVFLTARSPQDFKRNGLVAVFLRVLEYYAGILFLTTNRIGDFDEAFASRVHISLHYPQLDQQSTLEIFKLNLRLIRQRFEKKGRKLTIDDADILSFAEAYWAENEKMRWNGRQIRNGCQTALALAEFDAQGGSHERIIDANAEIKLQVGHLKTVSSAYLAFISYLTKLYGKDAERRAKAIGIRAREMDGKTDSKEDGDTPVKRGALHTPSSSSLGVATSTRPEPSPAATPAYTPGIPAAANNMFPQGNYAPATGPYPYYYQQSSAAPVYPQQNSAGQMANMANMVIPPGQQPPWQGSNAAGPGPGAWQPQPPMAGQGHAQGHGQGQGQGQSGGYPPEAWATAHPQ